MSTNLHPMLNVAIKAARAAGAIINRAALDVESVRVAQKQVNDFVTEVDKAAEQAIIETLLGAYPGHGILAEESGNEFGAKNSDYVWIIDPLDGTTNFLHGIPHFAISIAVMEIDAQGRKTITAGSVFDPVKNEFFYAEKGKGAFLNERRLRVSGRRSMADSLFGCGIPFLGRGSAEDHAEFQKQLGTIMSVSSGVRRNGAAALDLAWVAAGRLDGFWEKGLSLWDIAAGVLLVREAGGFISDFASRDKALDSGDVVAANPSIHGELIRKLRD